MYKIFSKLYDKFMKYSDYGAWENQMEELIKEGKPNGNTLLDIGCGTGELLLRMAKNYKCDGMDLSEDMLKIAFKKLKHREVGLFLGNMIDFDTGKTYDIMVSLFDTVNHILTLDELECHFKSVYKSLNPNGIYIFDVVDRKFMNEMFPNDLFVDNRKDLTCIWEHEIDGGIDYIDATYFLKNSRGSWDKFTESYTKKIFTEDEIKKSVLNANLKLIKILINDKIAGKRNIYLLKK
ncbi:MULTISPECIES: class I SAM-dependent methyltransferase [Fusobacterium]|jgi:cyclopropane fatty-acyl-phospholipid synthase-like methyltransferase|uniref:Class I SAM-dependent methyltransferase n=1 Tax=Fusobacterium hominis TaxID=2764326 RepID=A0A7G9GV46_9FUSO|nr:MULTISPECIES: class I SAM-dependent methyltransferase [Fusobacterium]QNM14678.1 class I SAM-dependent methyltransferase [Fusobacterium hominis]